MKRIYEIMNTKIIAVLPSDSIEECAMIMDKYKIFSIPVVSAGKLKGIVTPKIIAANIIADGLRPKDIRASEIMMTDIAFVYPSQKIKDAIDIMTEQKLKSIPVVSDGMIEGTISVVDLVEYCSQKELLNLVKILM